MDTPFSVYWGSTDLCTLCGEANIFHSSEPSHNNFPVIRVPQGKRGGGGVTLDIFRWGCAAGNLEPSAYTRLGSVVFCQPIGDLTPKILPHLRALSICQNWPAGPVRKQMKSAISTVFLLKNVLLHACYLGFDWSGRIVVIKSEIIISTRMIWPVSSDKWKAPLESIYKRP